MRTPANGGRPGRLLWNVIAACGLLGVEWNAPVSAADLHAEQSVKAAITLRFASYVEWPDDALPRRSFNIAVLGASDVASQLQQLATGRLVMNRPVQIRRITSVEDAADAHILYIGADRLGDLRTLLRPLAGHSILVVTDEEKALASGSIINLLVADQRVRFELSQVNARLARLRIRSELLPLAVRVEK